MSPRDKGSAAPGTSHRKRESGQSRIPDLAPQEFYAEAETSEAEANGGPIGSWRLPAGSDRLHRCK